MYWSKFLTYLGYCRAPCLSFCFFWYDFFGTKTISFSHNQLPSASAQDHTAKLQLCSKYLEAFTRAKEKEDFAELSIDLLVNMREIIMIDRMVFFL